MSRLSTIIRMLVIAALSIGAGACTEYLQVENPTVIDINVTNPAEDAPILASSAVQSFVASYGWMVMYSGWFSGESDVSETFPTRNEFGRRAVDPTNLSHRDDVWNPLHQGIAQAYLVLGLDLPNAASNIAYVRSHHALAWSYLQMAEHFCSGVVISGPELSTAQMLDSAIAHFTAANTQGMAVGGAEATGIANAAILGRARAGLQAGNKAAALTDANAVAAGFVFNATYFDDLANRTRLSNRIWQFIADRGSNAVPPAYRVDDPRLPWRVAPSNLLPQDVAYATDRGMPYAIQNKYSGFASPIRLASRLEADYIAAEATGSAAMLDLIQARRAANDQPTYSGNTDDASVLTEFEEQRAVEFYLEGKRLGDMRRNGAAVRNVPVTGSTYWKPGFAPVGNQTCYPIPKTERDNNPNLGEI